jgi:hypothetical protein
MHTVTSNLRSGDLMHRVRGTTVTMAAVMSLLVTMISASPAMAGEQSVQQIIRNKTGAAAALMTTPQKAGSASIGVGHSAAKALESYSQTPDAKTKRVLAVIADASQSTVTYSVTGAANAQVKLHADGSVDLVMDQAPFGPPPTSKFGTTWTAENVIRIQTPWAVDAAGKDLPTSYTFAGGVLTQKVDTTGASFPVVADPTYTTGYLSKYAHLSRTEVFQAYNGSTNYYGMGMLACKKIMSRYGTTCAVYSKAKMVALGQGIYKAAHSVWNGSSACLSAKVTEWVPSLSPIPTIPYYDYYYLNACTTW